MSTTSLIRRLITLAACLFPGCRAGQMPESPGTGLADEARWVNRLIVLSASERDDAILHEQQLRLDGMSDELAERHLLVVRLVPGDAQFGTTTLADDDITPLRSRWNISTPSFHAALVGKDGKVKDRWATAFDPGEMNALIDSMPMRQDEMQAQPR